ncbi:MAG: phosphatase PAP2 family protein [Polyangiaceae bacterium]
MPFSWTDLDHRLFACLYGGGLPPLAREAVRAVTFCGSGWAMFLIVPFLFRAKTRSFAVALTTTLVATAAIVFVTKALVGRPRPFVALPGVVALFDSPRDPSFPSGHAAGAFATAAFLAVTLRRAVDGGLASRASANVAAVLLFVAATCIGVSRVILGVHFPLDVVGGAFVGGMAGVVGARMHGARTRIVVSAERSAR